MVLLYIQPTGCHQRIYQLKLRLQNQSRVIKARFLPLSCCCAVIIAYFIPIVGVHRWSEEQVSGTSVLEILHRERTNKFLGSARRDCFKIFVTARPPSKSGVAANRRLWHRLLHSVNRTIFVRSSPFIFPKAKAKYIIYFSIQFLIMFSELIILLCLATSMIQLFMLDLVMFIIYLFRNLIMQLSNISTTNKMFIVETN